MFFGKAQDNTFGASDQKKSSNVPIFGNNKDGSKFGYTPGGTTAAGSSFNSPAYIQSNFSSSFQPTTGSYGNPIPSKQYNTNNPFLSSIDPFSTTSSMGQNKWYNDSGFSNPATSNNFHTFRQTSAQDSMMQEDSNYVTASQDIQNNNSWSNNESNFNKLQPSDINQKSTSPFASNNFISDISSSPFSSSPFGRGGRGGSRGMTGRAFTGRGPRTNQPQDSQQQPPQQFACRVCGQQFLSWSILQSHLKREGHYSTGGAPTPPGTTTTATTTAPTPSMVKPSSPFGFNKESAPTEGHNERQSSSFPPPPPPPSAPPASRQQQLPVYDYDDYDTTPSFPTSSRLQSYPLIKKKINQMDQSYDVPSAADTPLLVPARVIPAANTEAAGVGSQPIKKNPYVWKRNILPDTEAKGRQSAMASTQQESLSSTPNPSSAAALIPSSSYAATSGAVTSSSSLPVSSSVVAVKPPPSRLAPIKSTTQQQQQQQQDPASLQVSDTEDNNVIRDDMIGGDTDPDYDEDNDGDVGSESDGNEAVTAPVTPAAVVTSVSTFQKKPLPQVRSSTATSTSTSTASFHKRATDVTNTLSATEPSPPVIKSNRQSAVPEDADEEGVVLGLCTDMCPRQERLKRIQEQDLHRIEKALLSSDLIPNVDNTRNCMIKKCQRSAADHTLNIPHLVRTPRALLRTIQFIEDTIMDLDWIPAPISSADTDVGSHDKREGSGSSAVAMTGVMTDSLELYLFIWDRYRMIAKDFILQNYRYGGRVDSIAITCHERMARWFVMMEHQMLVLTAGSEDFSLVHAHQNQEQLNKILKTLNEFYDHAGEYGRLAANNPSNDAPSPPTSQTTSAEYWSGMCANEAEFRAYYCLSQLYNLAEVQRYLSRLSASVLRQPPLQFVLKVATAMKLKNFALFFRLLRESEYLQACCLFKYVCETRLQALRVLCRTYRAGKQESLIPVTELTSQLMFEDEEDVLNFLFACNLETIHDDNGFSLVMTGQLVDELLPTDPKSGAPILPTVSPMAIGIEDRIADVRRHTVTRGELSGAVPLVLEDSHEADEEEDDLEYDVDADEDPNTSLSQLDSHPNPTVGAFMTGANQRAGLSGVMRGVGQGNVGGAERGGNGGRSRLPDGPLNTVSPSPSLLSPSLPLPSPLLPVTASPALTVEQPSISTSTSAKNTTSFSPFAFTQSASLPPLPPSPSPRLPPSPSYTRVSPAVVPVSTDTTDTGIAHSQEQEPRQEPSSARLGNTDTVISKGSWGIAATKSLPEPAGLTFAVAKEIQPPVVTDITPAESGGNKSLVPGRVGSVRAVRPLTFASLSDSSQPTFSFPSSLSSTQSPSSFNPILPAITSTSASNTATMTTDVAALTSRSDSSSTSTDWNTPPLVTVSSVSSSHDVVVPNQSTVPIVNDVIQSSPPDPRSSQITDSHRTPPRETPNSNLTTEGYSLGQFSVNKSTFPPTLPPRAISPLYLPSAANDMNNPSSSLAAAAAAAAAAAGLGYQGFTQYTPQLDYYNNRKEVITPITPLDLQPFQPVSTPFKLATELAESFVSQSMTPRTVLTPRSQASQEATEERLQILEASVIENLRRNQLQRLWIRWERGTVLKKRIGKVNVLQWFWICWRRACLAREKRRNQLITDARSVLDGSYNVDLVVQSQNGGEGMRGQRRRIRAERGNTDWRIDSWEARQFFRLPLHTAGQSLCDHIPRPPPSDRLSGSYYSSEISKQKQQSPQRPQNAMLSIPSIVGPTLLLNQCRRVSTHLHRNGTLHQSNDREISPLLWPHELFWSCAIASFSHAKRVNSKNGLDGVTDEAVGGWWDGRDGILGNIVRAMVLSQPGSANPHSPSYNSVAKTTVDCTFDDGTQGRKSEHHRHSNIRTVHTQIHDMVIPTTTNTSSGSSSLPTVVDGVVVLINERDLLTDLAADSPILEGRNATLLREISQRVKHRENIFVGGNNHHDELSPMSVTVMVLREGGADGVPGEEVNLSKIFPKELLGRGMGEKEGDKGEEDDVGYWREISAILSDIIAHNNQTLSNCCPLQLQSIYVLEHRHPAAIQPPIRKQANQAVSKLPSFPYLSSSALEVCLASVAEVLKDLSSWCSGVPLIMRTILRDWLSDSINWGIWESEYSYRIDKDNGGFFAEEGMTDHRMTYDMEMDMEMVNLNDIDRQLHQLIRDVNMIFDDCLRVVKRSQHLNAVLSSLSFAFENKTTSRLYNNNKPLGDVIEGLIFEDFTGGILPNQIPVTAAAASINSTSRRQGVNIANNSNSDDNHTILACERAIVALEGKIVLPDWTPVTEKIIKERRNGQEVNMIEAIYSVVESYIQGITSQSPSNDRLEKLNPLPSSIRMNLMRALLCKDPVVAITYSKRAVQQIATTLIGISTRDEPTLGPVGSLTSLQRGQSTAHSDVLLHLLIEDFDDEQDLKFVPMTSHSIRQWQRKRFDLDSWPNAVSSYVSDLVVLTGDLTPLGARNRHKSSTDTEPSGRFPAPSIDVKRQREVGEEGYKDNVVGASGCDEEDAWRAHRRMRLSETNRTQRMDGIIVHKRHFNYDEQYDNNDEDEEGVNSNTGLGYDNSVSVGLVQRKDKMPRLADRQRLGISDISVMGNTDRYCSQQTDEDQNTTIIVTGRTEGNEQGKDERGGNWRRESGNKDHGVEEDDDVDEDGDDEGGVANEEELCELMNREKIQQQRLERLMNKALKESVGQTLSRTRSDVAELLKIRASHQNIREGATVGSLVTGIPVLTSHVGHRGKRSGSVSVSGWLVSETMSYVNECRREREALEAFMLSIDK